MKIEKILIYRSLVLFIFLIVQPYQRETDRKSIKGSTMSSTDLVLTKQSMDTKTESIEKLPPIVHASPLIVQKSSVSSSKFYG